MITMRYAIGWAAVAATVPYLVLKAVWLAGGTVGLTAPFDEPSAYVLNAVTAAMDVVAIVVALGFTYAWGRRVPGFLVLVPIWVGTGFLVPIALLLPTMDLSQSQPFLAPWVQPLVYGGFAFQGVMLTIAFVFYARDRWPSVFRLGTADVPAAGPVRLVVAHVGALLAAASGVRYFSYGTVDSVLFGVLALAAAGGVLVMTNRVRGRFWVPVVVTWVGAGSLFAWGMWTVVNRLGDTFLVGGPAPVWPALLDVTAGCLIGLTSLVLLNQCVQWKAWTDARR
ncbi:hypothetical protein [Actinophytocola sp. NPDC049390]|uniref:hypothetical protein n=1 Tax=Actinophytocola sp. NPDC049390 TaxID=3363894 RepID=UPI0037B647EB